MAVDPMKLLKARTEVTESEAESKWPTSRTEPGLSVAGSFAEIFDRIGFDGEKSDRIDF